MPNSFDWYSAFGGAFVGSLFGTLSSWGLNWRKEVVDRRNAANQVKRDYHFKQREHLARLIVHLTDIRYILEAARNIALGLQSVPMDEPTRPKSMDIYHAKLQEADAAMTKAMTEVTLYGKIPKDTMLENRLLVEYVEATLVFKLKSLYNKDIHSKEITDILRHYLALVRDIRTLMDLEGDLAKNSIDSKSKVIYPAFPFFNLIGTGIKLPDIKVEDLDIIYLEGIKDFT